MCCKMCTAEQVARSRVAAKDDAKVRLGLKAGKLGDASFSIAQLSVEVEGSRFQIVAAATTTNDLCSPAKKTENTD